MPVSAIEKQCQQSMTKIVDFFKMELRGIRSGQASTGLVDHLKIEVASYGSTMELRELAALSTPDPQTIVVKPFDPGTIKDIERGIRSAELGINPISDGKVVRLPLPALSGERRQQLINRVHKDAEAQKIALRNVRRDLNRQVDAEKKQGKLSEDQADDAKDAVQKLIKKYEGEIDEVTAAKVKEIETD